MDISKVNCAGFVSYLKQMESKNLTLIEFRGELEHHLAREKKTFKEDQEIQMGEINRYSELVQNAVQSKLVAEKE